MVKHGMQWRSVTSVMFLNKQHASEDISVIMQQLQRSITPTLIFLPTHVIFLPVFLPPPRISSLSPVLTVTGFFRAFSYHVLHSL